MVANKQHLIDLEAEAARVAAEEAAAAAAMSAEVIAAADAGASVDLSEFDQAAILGDNSFLNLRNQGIKQTYGDNVTATDFLPEDSMLLSSNVNPATPSIYQKLQGYESPFDAASNQFDLMTDANGYPLDGHTMDSIKKATDAKVAEVRGRPEQQPAIYPEQTPRYPSKGYLKNPDLYRKIHGDADADEQLRLYNMSEAGQQASAFDELVVAASENETLIAEKEAMAKKAEQFKDDPGFDLYQRNRKAFVIQYGEDKAHFYDIALGKDKTVLAQLQAEAKEKGYYDANGFNQSELGSALNFKAAAAETSSAASMVADAEAKFNTETENADQEFMESPTDIHADGDPSSTSSEADAKATATEIEATATEIVKGSGVNPNEATKQLAELPKLKTPEDKANWLSNIRSFYSENPEIAHAMVRAAAAYLRTGKWYEAAAAGLEGGIEGAGVKYAKDQHALAAKKAELSRQEGLRGKYTAASVNQYLKSGDVNDLIIDRAQEASTLRNTYTGPSVNAYIKSGDPEDLKFDFTKVDKNHDVYIKELKARGKAKEAEELAKIYASLSQDNVNWLETNANNMIGALEKRFANDFKGNEFKKSGFGVSSAGIKHMMLNYAKSKKNLNAGGGYFFLEQITADDMTAMQSIVEEYGEQQYQTFIRDGQVSPKTFDTFVDEMFVRQEASAAGVATTLLDSHTRDKEGEYAAESAVLVKNTMQDQIDNNRDFDFDFNPDIEGKQKPTTEQIWGQLQKHWVSIAPTEEERADKKNTVNGTQYSKNQLKWVEASGKIKDMPTSPFLEFARMWISKGDQYGFFKDNGMELFQEPK